MTHYNLLIIGFGKAGKTLAKYAKITRTTSRFSRTIIR